MLTKILLMLMVVLAVKIAAFIGVAAVMEAVTDLIHPVQTSLVRPGAETCCIRCTRCHRRL